MQIVSVTLRNNSLAGTELTATPPNIQGQPMSPNARYAWTSRSLPKYRKAHDTKNRTGHRLLPAPGSRQGKPASLVLPSAARMPTGSAPELTKAAPAASALETQGEAHTCTHPSRLRLTPCSPHDVGVLVWGWGTPRRPMPHHVHSTQRPRFSTSPWREKNSEEGEGVPL